MEGIIFNHSIISVVVHADQTRKQRIGILVGTPRHLNHAEHNSHAVNFHVCMSFILYIYTR